MDDQAVRTLYQTLIGAWNQQDAAGMAGCFAETGHIIGFDGSQMTGPKRDRSDGLDDLLAPSDWSLLSDRARGAASSVPR